MNGLADQEDLRLRFDVLTKTKQPELCRYWTQRHRAASLRLFRLVAEVLLAIEARVFSESWLAVQRLPVPEPLLGVAVGALVPGKDMNAMMVQVIPTIGKPEGERLREGGPS